MQLPPAGLALHLLIDFVNHTNAAGADGMPETLQPAVGIHRQVAFQPEGPVGDIGAGLPARAEAQILHNNQLGDGEAVVHHRQVNFGAGVGDAGFIVCGAAGADGFREVGKVPVVPQYAESAHRQPQPLDQDVVVAQRAGNLRRGDDGRRRPVADAAAVIQTQGPGNHRGVDDLFLANLPLEVGFGVEGAVVVVLGRNLRQGALAVVVVNVVVVEVAGGGHGELRRRRRGRLHIGTRPGGDGQPGKAAVLQLLHAHSQGDVIDAGGHGVASVAKGVGGGGAGILHAGDGDVVQLQRLRQGLAGAEAAHGAQPRRLDVVGRQPGVRIGFVGGLYHQIGSRSVPALAKARAAHADYGHPVSDTAHIVPPKFGTCCLGLLSMIANTERRRRPELKPGFAAPDQPAPEHFCTAPW